MSLPVPCVLATALVAVLVAAGKEGVEALEYHRESPDFVETLQKKV